MRLRCATCAIVALDQALGLGRRRLRIHAVLGDELDLAAHDAAAGVDFVDREVDAHHRVFAEWPEETRARRQVANADVLRLAANDGGKAQRAEPTQRGCSARTLKQTATTTADL